MVCITTTLEVKLYRTNMLIARQGWRVVAYWFTVRSRHAFGMWGSYVPLVLRIGLYTGKITITKNRVETLLMTSTSMVWRSGFYRRPADWCDSVYYFPDIPEHEKHFTGFCGDDNQEFCWLCPV
jgi:hypothetical protein